MARQPKKKIKITILNCPTGIEESSSSKVHILVRIQVT